MLSGSCSCGAVRYQLPDELLYAANCHCSSCRRVTGSAFKSFAGIERAKLRITQGEGDLMTFGDEHGRDQRCRWCGSFLYSIVRQGAFVHLGMGCLLDAPSIRPSAHIFVGSKAPWFEITDDLPQYDEHQTSSIPATPPAAPFASTPPHVRRGDVFWLVPSEARGAVPAIAHPHVVIQDDVLNRSRLDTVVVCALTSNLKRASEPGNVLLDAGEGELPTRSVLVVSQISCVRVEELGPRIGALAPERVQQIFDGMRFQQAAYFNR